MPELRFDDLSSAIAKGLAPVYLIGGEEPLLIEEALDTLRANARNAGYSERDVLHADASFDWNRLTAASDNLSLFSDRRLLELRLPGGKPGRDGAAVLKAQAEASPEDTLLVVITGRLEAAQRKSAWVQAFARAGVMSYAWPLRRGQLPAWIAARGRERGLQIERSVAELLVDRNEGNLLALAQEIDKLALLTGGGLVDMHAAQEAVTDSARFAVFDLPDAVLAGEVARSLRITERLRAEGEQPVLVLWGLARELRVLADLEQTAAMGAPLQPVMQRHRVWKQRQTRLEQLARQTRRGTWSRLLVQAARVDRIIKGAESGRPWNELVVLISKAARLAAAAQSRGIRS